MRINAKFVFANLLVIAGYACGTREPVTVMSDSQDAQIQDKKNNLSGEVSQFSPVIPTAETLADESTVRLVFDQFAEHPGDKLFFILKQDKCDEAANFLTALNLVSVRPNDRELDREFAILERYYRINASQLKVMSGWDIVWYHTGIRIASEYVSHCHKGGFDILVRTSTGTSQWRLVEGDRCVRYEDAMRRDFRRVVGETLYPGVGDSRKSEAEVIAIGMKGHPKERLDMLRFAAYSWAVQDEFMPVNHIVFYRDDLEALQKLEKWIPFTTGSWKKNVIGWVKGIACSKEIPKQKRQEFLNLYNFRMRKSKFWGSEVQGSHAEGTVTLEEICRE